MKVVKKLNIFYKNPDNNFSSSIDINTTKVGKQQKQEYKPWNIAKSRNFDIIHKQQAEQADEEVDKRLWNTLTKKEAFKQMKKLYTKERLRQHAQKLKEKWFFIDKELNNSKFVPYFKDFLEQNNDILAVVVEKWLFYLPWVCLSDKIVNELKQKYKKNTIDKYKKILDTYSLPNGKKLNISEIFKTDKCKPWVLFEKLTELVDENGKHLTIKKIESILNGIASVKKIETKYSISKIINDEEKENKYMNYLSLRTFELLDKSESEQRKILKKWIEKIFPNIKKEKLNKLVEKSLNYIKTESIDKILEKNFSDLDNIQKIEEPIVKFSKDKIPAEFVDKTFPNFYQKAFDEQKYAWKYILDKVQEKLDIDKNSIKYKIANKILTTFDIDKWSTWEIANKLIKGIENNPILNKLVPKSAIKYLKKLSNNARETEYFFKEWFITDTETVWLYSNNPPDLKKYTIENFWKAPDTEWKNQITSRIKFIEVLKKESPRNINAHWLEDYFLKSKIRYKSWDVA